MTLTVALDTADEAACRLHRTVLASLPGRFRVVTADQPGPADIAVISGDQPGCRDRALAAGAARAVMVTGARALTAAAVRELVKEIGSPVTASPAYGAGRAWQAAVPELIADLAGSALLDSVSAGPSLHAALVDQLAAIRPLLGDLRDPRDLAVAHSSGSCYVLAGVVGGVAVTLAGTVSGTVSGIVSGARRLDVDLVGAARHWHARLDADTLAFPARISVSDAGGERVLPPLHESPLRGAWAALHDACRLDAPLPYPAHLLADDLAIAEAVLGSAPKSLF